MALVPVTSVALAIDAYAETITIEVPQAGAWVNGRWDAPVAVTADIAACVFAPTATELQNLPEGLRAQAEKSLWSRDPQIIADPDGLVEGTRLTWNGQNYRVIKVHERIEGAYTKAILSLDRSENRDREQAP